MQTLVYDDAGTQLAGQLFLPEDTGVVAGGVVLLPEYTGPGPYMHRHAQRLVAAGYAVLLADMYGVMPQDHDHADSLARPLKNDRPRMRARAAAAVVALAAQDVVRQLPLYAMGFSFGGCAALELARYGGRSGGLPRVQPNVPQGPFDCEGVPALAGVVSVYGYLATPEALQPGQRCCPLCVHHGAHDRIVPLGHLQPFVEEMTRSGTDCRMVVHTDAGHGFCNVNLHERDERLGSWYCARTEERMWRDALVFLAACASDLAREGCSGDQAREGRACDQTR